MIVLSLATGDLDGDGLPDLVVATDGRTPLALFRNIGGGAFGLPTPLTLSLSGPLMEWVAVADLNGDRRADIVGAGSPTTAVASFLNTGGGRS